MRLECVIYASLPIRLGNTHRVYNYQAAHALVVLFNIIEESVLDSIKMKWVTERDPIELLFIDYLSMLLEKP